MAKKIEFDLEARDGIKRGVDALANAVKVTLGPKGRNVIIGKSFGAPQVTKDGVTVAKEIELEDTLENNPSSLDAVFNSMYSADSSLLSVSGGSNSDPTAGTYAFAMTAYVSGAFTGLVSSDTTPGVTASNNTIQVIVDGTTSGTITVPSAEYSSEAALATAIQTAINANSTLSTAGKTVAVTHSNGSYSITSGSKNGTLVSKETAIAALSTLVNISVGKYVIKS